MDYAVASTSLAHTYGNVTSFITEWVKQLFPKNYFKTVHISSTVAYRQFNIFQNTNKEFLKKNKPMLIIRPRIEMSENDNFLFGTLLTQRMTDNFDNCEMGQLEEFFVDKEKNIKIMYLLNRLKMFFDISVIVESQMEQINYAQFFKNRIPQEHYTFLSTSLESYVPKPLMEMLSKDVNVPLYDENGSIKPFLEFVNSKSFFPVTYKLKNSSGNDEFFRYYPVNIDTTVSGLSIDDGSKKGFIYDAFAINFTLSTEFNAAGLYYYFTENKTVISEVDMSMIPDSKNIVPIFTINNLFNLNIDPGWNLYSTYLYKVEFDDKPDTLPFKDLLNTSLLNVIDYQCKSGVPISTVIKVFVMKDNSLLSEIADEYNVDFTNFFIKTNKVNTLSTYRLIIHVNTLLVNQLIKDVYEFRDDN